MIEDKDDIAGDAEPTMLEIEGEDEGLPAFLRGQREEGATRDELDESKANSADSSEFVREENVGGSRTEVPAGAVVNRGTPASSRPLESSLGATDSKERAPVAPMRRQVVRSAKEFFAQELCSRAKQANERLRAHLLGVINFEIIGSNEKFRFDWSSDQPQVTEAMGKIAPTGTVTESQSTGTSASSSKAECSIRISENNFMRIANGDLNPQVAMLTEKIEIKGTSSLAIYFFNLLAPVSNY